MRLLIADHHEVTRAGVKLLIARKTEWEVCGEAASGPEVIAKVTECQPDVIVLDLSMRGMNGLEAAREIHRISPRTKIVFFSMRHVPAAAKQLGDNFVSQSSSALELIAAIQRVTDQP